MGDSEQRKLVVVGDGGVGKTCLLLRYAKDEFNAAYVPTVFETMIVDVVVNGVDVELSLWDTAGQEDYDRLRPLSYTDTHVVLIAFSVNRKDTLRNVSLKWITEVSHFCPDSPILLVGTKSDTREGNGNGNGNEDDNSPNNNNDDFVSKEEAEKVAAELGALAYLECSALKNVGIEQVFDLAVASTFPKDEGGGKGKKKCVLL